MRTLIPSRIIEQYKSYCKEQQFEPASIRCLFRMLEVCSASMQRSLHGLDNITAEGNEAFDKLRAIIDTLVENGKEQHWAEMRRDLTEANRRFEDPTIKRTWVETKTTVTIVPYMTLISDPENPDFCEECSHSLDIHCDRCDSLDSNFHDILKRTDDLVINDETRTRMNLENKECSRALHAWKAHLLLSVNQEEAKQNALTQLALPQHYREQMSEFFGKRGRSWHISAVITRSQEEGRCEVECFVHLFNTCKQNSFEVMSVIEHLLRSTPSRLSTLQSTKLFCDQTTLVVITVGA